MELSNISLLLNTALWEGFRICSCQTTSDYNLLSFKCSDQMGSGHMFIHLSWMHKLQHSLVPRLLPVFLHGEEPGYEATATCSEVGYHE